jgi:predicted metal-dependent hydrolase
LYDTRKQYAKEHELLETLNRTYPNTPELKRRLDEITKLVAADSAARPDSAH